MGSRPIANKYHEGTVKRTLKRKVKVLEVAENEVSEGTMSLRLLHTTTSACCASMRVAVGLEQALCNVLPCLAASLHACGKVSRTW